MITLGQSNAILDFREKFDSWDAEAQFVALANLCKATTNMNRDFLLRELMALSDEEIGA